MKFEKFLETANIKDEEKLLLVSLRKNIDNPKRYNCRRICIEGHPGVGKTEIAKRMLAGIKVPIIYLGLEPESHYLNLKDSSEVLETAEKYEKCVIFLDDVMTIMESQRKLFGSKFTKRDEKNLFRLFDLVDKSQNKILILVMQDPLPSSELADRLDAQIKVKLPKANAKKWFIQNKYSDILQEDRIDYLSKKTMGYTFRDIESVIKIVGSSGREISIQQIKKELGKYVPSALSKYDIIHVTDLNLGNIVGKEEVKEQLSRALESLKHRELAAKLGIRIKNLLFFYGGPGTGKTFMAKAIAGELELPIISINTSHIIREHSSPFENLKKVISLGNRFGESIILFDEAEKIFGRHILGEDSKMQGDLQGYLDGAGERIKSLVIFTLNEQAQFGEPLKDRFLMFKFENPTAKERAEFLKRKYNIAKWHFSISISPEDLASLIGDSSFREIEKVWDQTLLKKLTAESKEISKEDFEETIKLLKTKKENVLCG